MKKFLFPVILLVFLLASCGGGGEKPVEVVALQNEVMRIHDDVMAKMKDVKMLEGKMEKLMLDETGDTSEEAMERIKKAQQTRTDLEAAHDAMMKWMRAYRPNKFDEKEKAIAYLEDQEKEIIVVADKINGSIMAAKELLREASEQQ